MPPLVDRIRHAWNAFNEKDMERGRNNISFNVMSSSVRPDRPRTTRGNDRSIVNAIYNRIASDAAAIRIEHVRLDDAGRYKEALDTGLNNCLNLEANLDQSSRAFLIDVYLSMLDEGCIALVPTMTSANIHFATSFDIFEMRTGKILEWMPKHIKVRLYNQDTGKYEELILPKRSVAIVENPFYSTMNEKSSTLQRLIRKMNLLDAIDEQSSSGKFNMVIQLPYTIRSDAQKTKAEERKQAIEEQLVGSKYGIAYVDATEKITQLGRPLENNLMAQIEFLTSMLYSQLGFTSSILDGTADEKTMLNYDNNIIEPMVSTVVNELKRKFLTKTARTQKQSIMFFRDPFRLVPVNEIADIADKFTRNEIMSSNEFRQVIGLKPVEDPQADELRNKNINASDGQEFASTGNEEFPMTEDDEMMNETGYEQPSDLDVLMQTPISSIMD